MHEEYHGETIDHCLSCGGLWFDANELRAILKRSSGTQVVGTRDGWSQAAGQTPASCPRCRSTTLSDIRIRDVLVHSCTDCKGIFVGPKAFLAILDRKGFTAVDGTLDSLIMAPEVPAAAFEGVLEILGEVFCGW